MTLNEALEITGPLGSATKLPCHTYNISAFSCHRGSKLREIEGSVCRGCYARKGNFTFPTVQAALNRNQDRMLNPQWAEAMSIVLTAYETSGYFRFFSSGDIQSLWHLIQICKVCRLTPHIKFWLPTHEVGILQQFKRAGFEFPDNLTVRLSADFIDKSLNHATLDKLGVLGGEVSKTGNENCPAHKQNNMCQTCRTCWNKEVKIVTYRYH